MIVKTALRIVAISLPLSACAFFDEPLNDTDGAVPANIPVVSGPPPSSSLPAPPPPSQPLALPNNQPVQPAGTPSPVYFTVTTFDELPDNVSKMAFVHLTNLGASRDTTRELAVCKSVTSKYPVTPASQVPADATLLVWPVRDSGGSDICLEMLTRYDPVDIRQATAARVNELAAGPFLLARGPAQDQRMIYDMSNVPADRLPGAFDNWARTFSAPPASWPAYRFAR